MLLVLLLILALVFNNGFLSSSSSPQMSIQKAQEQAIQGIMIEGGKISPDNYRASTQIPIRIATQNSGPMYVSFNSTGYNVGGMSGNYKTSTRINNNNFPFIPKCSEEEPCEVTKERPLFLNWNPGWIGPGPLGPGPVGGCGLGGCSFAYTVAPGYGPFVGGNPWGVIYV
jgi:hypothetical protein